MRKIDTMLELVLVAVVLAVLAGGLEIVRRVHFRTPRWMRRAPLRYNYFRPVDAARPRSRASSDADTAAELLPEVLPPCGAPHN